LFKKSYTINLS